MPFDQVLATTVTELTAARDHLNEVLEAMPADEISLPLRPAREAVLTAQKSIRQAVGILIGTSWVTLWNLTADTRGPEEGP